MKKAVSAIAAALVLPASLGAAIIDVPSQQPSIQAGMDAAADGDTVMVARGRYFENVNFRGKRVVLASGYILSGLVGDIDSTVIDGSQPLHPDTASCVLIFRPSATDSADTAAALIGLTLTNGKGTFWADKYVAGTSNIEGGGLLIENCSPRIRFNRIIGNRAMKRFGCFDGAGGGIKCTDGRPEINHNVIALNSTSDHAGGVLLWHAGGIVSNNIVAGNRAGGTWGGGGGICVDVCQGWQVKLENNILAYNRAGPNNGGGIHVWNSSPCIANCIIWGNEAQQILNEGGTVTAQFCDIQGGLPGCGNLDADPELDQAAGFLGPGSPCIDAGNDSLAYNDPEDPAQPGQALWPSQGTTRNDMGAFGGPWATVISPMPPYIYNSDPFNNQYRVTFDSPVAIAFSHEMDTSSLVFHFDDSSIVFERDWNADGDTLVLTHVQNFENFTWYRLIITGGLSQSGDSLVPLPDTISFRTLDTANPRLVSTQPYDGQTGVATNAIIRLWFSKPVSKSTLTYAFSDTSYHFTLYQTNDSVISLGHIGHLFAGGTTYTMELTAFQDTCGNAMGSSLVPNPFTFTTAGTGVEGVPGQPGRRTSLEVFPNPSDGSSGIVLSLGLGSGGSASLSVYDVSGRKVAILADGLFAPGTHTVFWNGRGPGGGRVGAGCYFCLLRAPEGEVVRRLVISR